ncbi:hypothetical protein [Notoacmeibacter marinus]|nr:hypothetical protein [Notoacmeibacter marinus]
MTIPDIPQTDDPEFETALTALVRSAAMIDDALILMSCVGLDLDQLMSRHGEAIILARTVINAWRDHMGVDD